MVVGTDTSNALNGRQRRGSATVTVTPPLEDIPTTVSLAEIYDKAIAYAAPDMVDGRPT